MNYREVEICSIDFRTFLEAYHNLVKKGAELSENSPCFTRPTVRVKVLVPEQVEIEKNPVYRIVPNSKQTLVRPVESKAKGDRYTKEELELMTLKQVRDITGAKSGKNKQEMIENYLNQYE